MIKKNNVLSCMLQKRQKRPTDWKVNFDNFFSKILNKNVYIIWNKNKSFLGNIAFKISLFNDCYLNLFLRSYNSIRATVRAKHVAILN